MVKDSVVELHCSDVNLLFLFKITRQDVKHFTSGQRIPKCELLIQWSQKAPPACLQCQIDLLGAYDGSYFVLDLDPGIIKDA